jgi:hypothetical protein
MTATPLSPQSRPTTFGARFAQAWTRVYTLGVAPGLRERRIAQIASDSWEHLDDARLEGRGGIAANFELLGRSVRGMAADLTWRFQLEGPLVNISIPIEKVAGIFFLGLVLAMALSLSANGYDASHDGFYGGELERLADVGGSAAGVYAALQVASGLAMVFAAGVFYRLLNDRAPVAAMVASLSLAAAGLVVLIGSVVYFAATDLADEWAANPADPAPATVARGLLVILGGLAGLLMVTLAIAVYSLAIASLRLGLVRRPITYMAGASAVCLVAALFALPLTDSGEFVWIASSFGLLLMWLWVAAAGISLVFGGGSRRSGAAPPPPSPQPAV